MILCICPNPSIDTYWWMEDIKNGAVNRVEKQEPFPGGKGVHVALNIAELNEEVNLLGIWAGYKGNWIRENCEWRKVPCFGINIDGENRSCITVRSKNAAIGNTEFLENGPLIVNSDYEHFLSVFEIFLHKCRLVVLSGSWPKGAPEDPYGPFIDAAKKCNIPVWLDCSGETLEQAILHQPFGIHLNKEEASTLCRDDEKVKTYFLQYVQQLALTSGRDGLFFYTKENDVQAVCTVENVVCTVGCGDALLAGIAVASVRNYPVKEIAKLGTACGSANCVNSDLGMIKLQDVERLIGEVILYNQPVLKETVL
ncbi:1-phosphofructokinase family hexose kinase [soil metagenome]